MVLLFFCFCFGRWHISLFEPIVKEFCPMKICAKIYHLEKEFAFLPIVRANDYAIAFLLVGASVNARKWNFTWKTNNRAATYKLNVMSLTHFVSFLFGVKSGSFTCVPRRSSLLHSSASSYSRCHHIEISCSTCVIDRTRSLRLWPSSFFITSFVNFMILTLPPHWNQLPRLWNWSRSVAPLVTFLIETRLKKTSWTNLGNKPLYFTWLIDNSLRTDNF